ncbi:hypothetical protein BHM03_00040187 [Ensete ventricosum]|nr:hypothetical protein BHM03_00040187 [Ensete ventricosum]
MKSGGGVGNRSTASQTTDVFASVVAIESLAEKHPNVDEGLSLRKGSWKETFEPLADASGSTTRVPSGKGKEPMAIEEAPELGYTLQVLCEVEDHMGAEKYFATIMTWMKVAEGFESSLEKMGRVSYEFGYRVAFEWLWGKHSEKEVEQDPFVECPKDGYVGMDLSQPFDDSSPLEK